MDRPAKRQRVAEVSQGGVVEAPSAGHKSLASLHRAVTPPSRSRPPSTPCTSDAGIARVSDISETQNADVLEKESRILRSPFQLTHIRDFPPSSGNNVDTIRLRDILGDPMIRECWQFNYCFDVDFVMSQFDEDVRNIVKVKIVHGSWKKDSPNRIAIDVWPIDTGHCVHYLYIDSLQEACARYPNAEAMTAYMPEPFGTHHSKMMVLLRHDDLAQYEMKFRVKHTNPVLIAIQGSYTYRKHDPRRLDKHVSSSLAIATTPSRSCSYYTYDARASWFGKRREVQKRPVGIP